MKCSRCGKPLKRPALSSGALVLGPVCAARMRVLVRKQRKAGATELQRQMSLALEATA